jgi:protein TonB
VLASGSLRPWVVAVGLSVLAHVGLVCTLPSRFSIAHDLTFLPLELEERPAPPKPVAKPIQTPVARPTRPLDPPPPAAPPLPRERESPGETPMREVTTSPPPAPSAPAVATPSVDPTPAPTTPVVPGAMASENRRDGVTESAAPASPPATVAPPSGSAPAVASARGSRTDPSRSSGTSADGITKWASPRGGYQVYPTYPASARRSGLQGTARLRVEVLADGRVGEILVEVSAGHPDLDRAATDAVRRWRFEPARRGPEPVASWVLLPVEFRIEQSSGR